MSALDQKAAMAIAVGMAEADEADRAEFLRQVVWASAGALMLIEGGRPAAEYFYGIADTLAVLPAVSKP